MEIFSNWTNNCACTVQLKVHELKNKTLKIELAQRQPRIAKYTIQQLKGRGKIYYTPHKHEGCHCGCAEEDTDPEPYVFRTFSTLFTHQSR